MMAAATYDVFVCHASDDKAGFVEPLVAALIGQGLRVWYDRLQIRPGDLIAAKINEGLAASAFGVLVLSPRFWKYWTEQELGGLHALEAADPSGRQRVVPVWCGVGHLEVARRNPILAARQAVHSGLGVDGVARALVEHVRGVAAVPLALDPTPAAPPDPAPAAPPAPAPISVANRLRAFVVGYDVFISYRHADAKAYALALREQLRRGRGLTSFVDVADAGGGASIEQMKKIACTARALVVVVTDGVFDSDYVRDELAEYRRRRILRWWRRPMSRIIPINVDGALSRAPAHETWRALGDHVFVPEAAAAVVAGTPSDEVLAHVGRSASFIRTGFFSGLAAVAVVLVIAGLIIRGLWQVRAVKQDLIALREERGTLFRQKERLQTDNAGLRTQRDELTAEKAELVESTTALQALRDDLQEKTAGLERRNSRLSIEGDALLGRSRAQHLVDEDPVRALRLVAQSEAAMPSPANAEVIRRAISTWDLTYTHEFEACQFEDGIGTKLLLRCGSNEPGTLMLFDVARRTRAPLRIPAGDSASFVGDETPSRILVVGDDYRLFELDGRQVGEPMSSRWDRGTSRCSRTLALMFGADDRATRWDLVHDVRDTVPVSFEWRLPRQPRQPKSVFDPSVPFGGLPRFRQVYGCRADGSFATTDEAELTLVDEHGILVSTSTTKVDLEHLYPDLAWSPDGRALVLDRSGMNPFRFGVWRPGAAAVDWLVSDQVLGFAWSTSGRLLAFSWSRSPGVTRSTLEITTADDPAGTRRAISTKLEVHAVAFSPDDRYLAVLGERGQIEVIDLVGNRPVRRAQHPGAAAIAWVGDRLVTWGDPDVLDAPGLRIWPVEPARARWEFVLDKFVFSRCAAADPRSRWLAARYQAKGGHPAGIVVRDLTTGAERILPDDHKYCREMLFTHDGAWLIAIGGDRARFWDTATWAPYELSVGSDQFFWRVWEAPGALGLEVVDPEPDERKYMQVVALDRRLGPHVVDRPLGKQRTTCSTYLQDALPGWQDSLARARAYEAKAIEAQLCPGVPWQVRFWCPLRDDDCEVEFVPTDLELARRLVDKDVAR